MKETKIHALVDQLLARDHCYRPIELLKLIHRLAPERQRQWESGQLAYLEDGLAGDPDQSVAVLRVAADWAGRLKLDAEVEQRPGRQNRLFRNANADRLARTHWRRPQTAQADLFFDNSFAVARARLARALLAGDAGASEDHLAAMARAEPANAVQADAEHLVDALGWLRQSPSDPAALLSAVDQDLAPRADRVLSRRDGEKYLEQFWRHLLGSVDDKRFDPDRPQLHPSALHERLADWQAVVSSILDTPDWHRHAVLVGRLASAGLTSGRREQGLAALCQLCWRHPEAASAWLDGSDDDELTRRAEHFWDLDPELDIKLFPAWLVARGYAMPDVVPSDQPDHTAAEAMPRMKALRQDPENLALREWFQAHQPVLFQHWLKKQ
ncbi:MAG: hypothetical protein ACNA7J_02095 [Wenzhouxiangella sp.]